MNDQPFDTPQGDPHRVAYLIAGFIRKTLSEQEHDELDAWVEASDENMRLFEELTDEKNIYANLDWMDSVKTDQRLSEVKKGLSFQKASKRKRLLWPYAVAASLLVLIVAAYLLHQQIEKPNTTAQTDTADILRAKSNIVLKLSDGRVIDLDAANSGALNTTDGSIASKADAGGLRYETSGSVMIHTLSTSPGGKYKVTLADGTRVWLNAMTSLRYPTAFNGNERSVELSGEAYFEVAPDPSKPFSVKLSGNETVTVLGTHFNVQNYADEAERAVTLLEGKVKISKAEKALLLSPTQQALLRNESMMLSPKTDIEEVMGWKDGVFIFHGADIKTIMRQLQRWYDIEVEYEAQVQQMFHATINRSEPLSKVLKLMELTGKVHFKVLNKKVYVLQ